MSDDQPEPDLDALESVTEISISVGRKKQLDQYEPINEQNTLTLEFGEGETPEEKQAAIEAAEQYAWNQTDRGLMQRFEEHLRQDDG